MPAIAGCILHANVFNQRTELAHVIPSRVENRIGSRGAPYRVMIHPDWISDIVKRFAVISCETDGNPALRLLKRERRFAVMAWSGTLVVAICASPNALLSQVEDMMDEVMDTVVRINTNSHPTLRNSI